MAARARPYDIDNIYKFYDRSAMIPNYISRVKVQTQLANYARHRGMTLRASYVVKVTHADWRRDMKRWMKSCFSHTRTTSPHHALHCIQRTRMRMTSGPTWRRTLMKVQAYCRDFDFHILTDLDLQEAYTQAMIGRDMIRIPLPPTSRRFDLMRSSVANREWNATTGSAFAACGDTPSLYSRVSFSST